MAEGRYFAVLFSAVRFSEDGKKVFILLDTGELLTVSSENRPLNNDLAARKDNWNRIAEKVYKKVEDYYAGIEE